MAQGAARERRAEKDAKQAEWRLHRRGGDEWCSLSSTPSGGTPSMHRGAFTVLAEGTEADVPHVRLRRKPDRRKV